MVFATDDTTGKLQATRLVKEQLRTLLATGSLVDAADAKDGPRALVETAAQPETNRHCRLPGLRGDRSPHCHRSNNSKAGANNSAVKHIKRTCRGFTSPRRQNTHPVAQCRKTAA
jgi:hypothetical protein